MALEARSAFLVELIGYIIVFGLIIFVSQWRSFKKIIAAFLISGIFVYLGSFYYQFMWIFKGEYVTGVPFWYEFSRSEHVKSYLESRTLALHYWMENPIIGFGEGGLWLKPDGGIHAHSTYFTILVNRGLIGLILF